MKKIIKKFMFILIFGISIIGLSSCTSGKEENNEAIRVVQASELDCDEYLKTMDDVTIKTSTSKVELSASKTFTLDMLNEIDNVDLSDIKTDGINAEYNVHYSSEDQSIELECILKYDETSVSEIISGTVVYNNQGELDSIFESEDGIFYLSDLYDATNVLRCGFFSKLLKTALKTVVVAAVAAVAVVAVVAIAPVVVSAVATITTAAGLMLTTTATSAIAYGLIGAGFLYTWQQLSRPLTLGVSEVLDAIDELEFKTDKYYLLNGVSSHDEFFTTSYVPVDKKTAVQWLRSGGNIWSPLSTDIESAITTAGYIPGVEKGGIGFSWMAEIHYLGTFTHNGMKHYHMLNGLNRKVYINNVSPHGFFGFYF